MVIENVRVIKIRDKDFWDLTIKDTDKHRFYKSPYECVSCKKKGKINSDRRITLLWSLSLPIDNIMKTVGESLVWSKCGHYKAIQLSNLQREEIWTLLKVYGYRFNRDKVKQLFE